MNLKVLKKSNKAPAAGDIFVFQLIQLPEQCYFGRVIRTDAKVGGFNDTILIYIYRTSSKSKYDIPALSPTDLMAAPMATNRLPWRKGYFENIVNRKIKPADLLALHAFRSPLRDRIYDDNGFEVAPTTGLIGINALHSYQTIDDEISKALGLPLFK